MLPMRTACINNNPVIRFDKQDLTANLNRLAEPEVSIMAPLYIVEFIRSIPDTIIGFSHVIPSPGIYIVRNGFTINR
ncbi:hypothetical protein D3C73_1552490 [compost metagenome]